MATLETKTFAPLSKRAVTFIIVWRGGGDVTLEIIGGGGVEKINSRGV